MILRVFWWLPFSLPFPLKRVQPQNFVRLIKDILENPFLDTNFYVDMFCNKDRTGVLLNQSKNCASLGKHQGKQHTLGCKPKKNIDILKSNSIDVMQTVFFAFTYKFDLVS